MTEMSRFPLFQPDLINALNSIDNPAETELQQPHGHGHGKQAALSLTELMSGRAVGSFKSLTASQQAAIASPWVGKLAQKKSKEINDAKKPKTLSRQKKKVVPRSLMS